MEGSQNIDFEFKTDENGDNLNLYDLEGASNAKRGADPSFSMDGNVGLPELHESRDPEPTKRNGRYNLRKSLAWDSAFFTSAGVLDPEELSTMITGTDEAEKNLLPRIEEDINGSTESISSFQSDSLTLESHEDDLFVDIRASIQRSSKKASIFTYSTCKKPDTAVDNQAISSLEKEDSASLSKNPKLAIKKTVGLQAVRTLKGQPKQNTGKPAGLGGPLKQNYIQSHNTQVKSTSKTGPSTPVLRKPPMAIAKTVPNSTSTAKRDTMGSVAKSACGSLKPAMASRKGTQPPKAPVPTGAGRMLSKPAVSSKSSLASSTSSMVQSSRLSTSTDSSSSISSSSKPPAKSPLMIAKQNPLKTSNVVTGPSGSVAKSSSRAAVKIRPAPSSKISALMKSTKASTSVSPASSISEWSSVSSSSSSMVIPRSNISRTSLGADSRKFTDSDVILPDRKNHSPNHSVDGHKNKEIALPGNNLKKASTGGVQALTRPSGLRFPSPKIGFFDGANSSRTPNKAPQSQSGSRNVLSNSEAAACTPNRSSNIKTKSSNVPTASKVTALVNAKSASSKVTPLASSKGKSLASGNDALVSKDIHDVPKLFLECKDNETGQDYQKTDEAEVGAGNQVIDVMSAIDKNLSDLKIEILKEKSNASGNNALVLTDIDDDPSLSLETKDNATGQNYHNANEIEVTAGNQVIDAVMSAIDKNLGGLKKEMEQNDKEFLAGSNASGLEHIDQEGSGDAIISQNNIENKFHPISEGSDKENGNVINQGEGVKVHDRNVNICASGPMNEVLSDILDCVISFPTKASKSSPVRSPFAEKNLSAMTNA